MNKQTFHFALVIAIALSVSACSQNKPNPRPPAPCNWEAQLTDPSHKNQQRFTLGSTTVSIEAEHIYCMAAPVVRSGILVSPKWLPYETPYQETANVRCTFMDTEHVVAASLSADPRETSVINKTQEFRIQIEEGQYYQLLLACS